MALDAIADLGARTVIITHDSGCFARFREERRARRVRVLAPRVEALAPAGSGDVLLAGFVGARFAGDATEDALRKGVAAGAVSTLELGAGRFEPREVARVASEVRVEELEPVG
jgi:fructose-1-phosphate kinase PfkB-like protein